MVYLQEKLEQRHVPVGRILEKEEAISELLAAGGSTADMCIVCFGEYRGGDTLRRLKCDHAFHVECIDRWCAVSLFTARCCLQWGFALRLRVRSASSVILCIAGF